MAKAICVLDEVPVTGHPKSYARDEVPILDRYPDHQASPTSQGVDSHEQGLTTWTPRWR
jgi:formate dehydrogenase